MDELITFIRHQLDARERQLAEDEGLALQLQPKRPGPWIADYDYAGPVDGVGVNAANGELVLIGRGYLPAEFAAEWNPDRVLEEVRLGRAEVAVKRAILDLHSPQPTGYIDGTWNRDVPGQLQCEHCAELCHSRSGIMCEQPDAPCPTVRLLAQPYAGRPGWREEWDTPSNES